MTMTLPACGRRTIEIIVHHELTLAYLYCKCSERGATRVVRHHQRVLADRPWARAVTGGSLGHRAMVWVP